MTTIRKQVVIARPIDQVLRYTRERRTIPDYLDYIDKVTPTTENTEGKGARYLVELRFLGRAMSSEWETVAYDRDRGWTFKAPLMGVDSHKTWSFEPLGDSTKVDFTLEYEPKPPVIAPLMDALLLRRRWDAIYERGLQNLKRVIEAQPAD
jgi:uncharacterized membrane protein